MRRGPKDALVYVYLPVLLLLPFSYHWEFTLHLTFAETAIIPIVLFYLVQSRHWRWGLCDLAVAALAAVTVYSEYVNSGYPLAQSLAIRQSCNLIFPYVLGKGILQSEEMSGRVAKTVVILLTIIAITSLYEFRMTTDLYKELPAVFFPDQADPFATRRYGFTRIAGSFPHPILAGMVLIAAYRLARWLEWTENWPGDIPFLAISKARFCELALLGGSLMTLSRGPWVGGIAAALAISLCRVRSGYALALRMLLITVVALPAIWIVKSYVSVERGNAASATQETAAYRNELIQKYIAIAEERPAWGWGYTDKGGGQAFPIVDGMTSIDNHYLLLALQHGEYALALMVIVLLWTPFRLIAFSVRRSYENAAALLMLSLAGIYIAFAVSLATAWLGGQTQPLLFLIAGWSEGLLLNPASERVIEKVSLQERPFRFERIMV
jgi:O-Antigen ligase